MLRIRVEMSPQGAGAGRALLSRVEAGIDAGFASVVGRAAKRARALAPERTGRLKRGIGSYLTGRRAGVLRSRAPYSSFLHHGTRLSGPGDFLRRPLSQKEVEAAFERGFEEVG